jgi:hypothetical protein
VKSDHRRPLVKLTDPQIVEITVMYAAGMPAQELASEYGVSRPTIIRAAERGGATIRQPRGGEIARCPDCRQTLWDCEKAGQCREGRPCQ